jgi:DNA polymerase I-like protein with 3'-5' exonuclease and polymerase domains
VVCATRRTVKVYDLINAGPRHRFTANGKLVHNCYLITYGGEPDKLFSTMASDRDKITFELNFPGITPEQTQRRYDAWHRVQPETKRWQNNCVHEAKTRGSVAGIGDYRRRFFFGGLNKRNAAAFASIQGSAAYIANGGVINLSEIIRFRSWSSMTGLVLQIHDYIGAFVPVQYAEYAYEAIKREMPWNYKGMDLGVDAKISTSWAYQ